MSDSLRQDADRLVQIARNANESIVTAESCTAGLLASILAGAKGASDVFHGAFITYTKANKTKALGVPEAVLHAHTAVSSEVAKAMAAGALARSPATAAVAITGVAGPEKDEDDNPVGLVYIGVATRDCEPQAFEYRFAGEKHEICEDAMKAALARLTAALA